MHIKDMKIGMEVVHVCSPKTCGNSTDLERECEWRFMSGTVCGIDSNIVGIRINTDCAGYKEGQEIFLYSSWLAEPANLEPQLGLESASNIMKRLINQ